MNGGEHPGCEATGRLILTADMKDDRAARILRRVSLRLAGEAQGASCDEPLGWHENLALLSANRKAWAVFRPGNWMDGRP